mgnify:CR=1 FL=1
MHEVPATAFDALLFDLGGVLLEIDFQRAFAAWGAAAGVRPLLARAMQRHPLYLFSNTSAVHRDHWLPRLGTLLEPFRGVYLSFEIGLRKPDLEAFAHVVRAIGVAPGRIAFFDDTEANVAGARRAGLQAFHVRSSAALAAALGFS